MAEHFTYTFEDQLPRGIHQQEWKKFKKKPLLSEVVAGAHEVIGNIEAFQVLPERNQQLMLDMSTFAMEKANRICDAWSNNAWRENFWGLYVIGSRARGEAQSDSDLDLLSVGTFYRNQGFSDWTDTGVFDGFELETPDELPSEYNIGDVDRKYLVCATPTTEDVLPVDLSVVDLTFWRATLDSFKEAMDVGEDFNQLPRIPIFEITTPKDVHAFQRP